MNDPAERAALDRLKRGDAGGLAALVEAHQVKAARAAYLIVRDRALAQDIVQTAFVRFYEHSAGFDMTRPFAPYFMRMVVNAALAALKTRDRSRSLDAPLDESAAQTALEDVLADAAASPENALEAEELRAAVEEALGKLSPEQRAAVVLRYYLGLSEADMAARLDIPTGTVKWRLHAARKQLRAVLRPLWPLTTTVED